MPGCPVVFSLRRIVGLFLCAAAICIVWAGTGCAPAQSTTGQKDELTEKLKTIQLGESISIPATLPACDPDSLGNLKHAKPDWNDPARDKNLWNHCLSMYSCSPTTAKLIAGWGKGSNTFRLGIGSLRTLNVPPLRDRLSGAYMTHSQNIYLDDNLPTQGVACVLMLHELVHRFDQAAFNGEESLKTEFRAYWHQWAFVDELLILTDFEAQEINGRKILEPKLGSYPGFRTRDELHAEITANYHFNPDEALIKSYPKLPIEALFEEHDKRLARIDSPRAPAPVRDENGNLSTPAAETEQTDSSSGAQTDNQ